MARQAQAQPNKRGPGAPTKRAPAVEKEIVRLLRQGNTRKTAAEVVGIHPATLRRWCALSARFCALVTQAEASAVSLYVNALTTNAVSGDTKAIIFYLTHRHGDEWKPPKETTVHEGSAEAPLVVRVEYAAPDGR